MDRYSCKWPLWFAQNGATRWAVTLGQTTYYSESEKYVMEHPNWQRHEDCHKAQWKRDGYVKFAVRYLWQFFTKSYTEIDYEVEARAAEGAE